MSAKILTIATAIVFAVALGLGQAVAQEAEGEAPVAADPFATAVDPFATAVDPFADPLADPFGAPVVGEVEDIELPTVEVANPYGMEHLIEESDYIIKGTLFILIVMSLGSWYVLFVKYIEQSKALNQAKIVERRFWTAPTLEEGMDKIGKKNIFRNVVERGQQAMSRQEGLSGGMSQSDWLSISLQRAVDEENARLAGGGIALLASVGSTSPFVGLFGTVWGILNALTAIGIAGQASIDRVAGPVGEALILTALGLAVAVPAVLSYNLLVRRNKVLNEKFRSFAADLQTYLLTSKRAE